MAPSLEQEVVQLREQVQQLLALVGELRSTVDRQQAHIAKLVKMTFGSKSERILGPTLFDEVAPDPSSIPVVRDLVNDIEMTLEPTTPKRKGHGRRPNPTNLPRCREEIDLTEAEKVCPCCDTMRVRIGETIRERLDYKPSSIFVREIAQPTYVCRRCEQAALDPQFTKPMTLPEPVPRSGIASGLLAQIIVSKYIDHLPLYRQEAIFARMGWPVSRTRLCELLGQCAVLLEPIYKAMITRMKQSFAIHVDETTVQLLQPKRTGYAWLYLGDADHPDTIFDFTTGRDGDYPTAFLKGYSGFVHADGYSGYNGIHGNGARHLGCWAHVRRKFVEAQTNNPVKSTEALAFIRTLYAVEKEISDRKLTGDSVVSLRTTRAGPILSQFGEWLEQENRTALPKSPFGQAITYARNLWPTLGRYLEDARFTIDNNRAERAVRPLAIGRKNWLFIGGDSGLKTASVLMSLCATTKRHDVNPWHYFADVLDQLATQSTAPAKLLPDVWKQSQLPTT